MFDLGELLAVFSGEALINLLIALGILVGGWVVARFAGFLTRNF